MSIKSLNPYLNFEGTGAKAIKLYESALGAKVSGEVMRYGDVPGNTQTAETKDYVMHAMLQMSKLDIAKLKQASEQR